MTVRNGGCLFPYFAILVVGVVAVTLQSHGNLQSFFDHDEATRWDFDSDAPTIRTPIPIRTKPSAMAMAMATNTTNLPTNTTLPTNTNLPTTSTSTTNTHTDTDTRPWLIVHVGPPKTATTTIQEGFITDPIMTKLALEDNLYYAGMKLGKPTTFRLGSNSNINSNSNTTSSTPSTSSSLSMSITTLPMKTIIGMKESFAELLEEHRAAGRNVVISSEHYTSRLNHGWFWDRMFDHTFLRNRTDDNDNDNDNDNDFDYDEDFDDGTDDNDDGARTSTTSTTSTRTTTTSTTSTTSTSNDFDSEGDEPLFGFRVKIVVAYRHFFSWLPSLHYQHYKLFPKYIRNDEMKRNRYIPGLVEYIEDYLADHHRIDANASVNVNGDNGSEEDDNDDANGNKDDDTNDNDNDNDNKDDDAAGANSGEDDDTDNGTGTNNNNDNDNDDETAIEDSNSAHIRNSDGAKYRGLSGSLFAYRKFTSRPELYDRVDVFDMHQQPLFDDHHRAAAAAPAAAPAAATAAATTTTTTNGLFTNFVCQALPSAIHTCRYLQADEARGQNSTHNIVKRTRKGTIAKGEGTIAKGTRKRTRTLPLLSLQDKHRLLQEARARLPPHVLHPETTLRIQHQDYLHDRIERWFYLPVGAEGGVDVDVDVDVDVQADVDVDTDVVATRVYSFCEPMDRCRQRLS